MSTFSNYFKGGLACLILAGCASTQPSKVATQEPSVTEVEPAKTVSPEPTIVVTAGYAPTDFEEDLATISVPDELPSPDFVTVNTVGLPELIGLTLQYNPRLAEVSWAIDAARGRAVQAGLYPNPTTSVNGVELSDRTGPGGIWSVFAGQEIVTANKLGLSQAAACKEVDQATLNLVAERYQVFTEVRQAFFEAVTLQQRADILVELVALAEQSTDNANKLVKAKEAAELDVVQLEVDLERYRADLDATRRALPAAYRKVAASVGMEEMQITRLTGDLHTPLSEYDLDLVRIYVLSIHPEIRSAQVGVERARLVLERARVEPIFPT